MKNITKLLMIIIMFMFNISFVNANELPFGMTNQEVVEGKYSTQVPVGPTITLDDATEYVNERGARIVVFLQNIAKPITLVVMVVCGLMAVLSGLTGGRDGGSSKWIIAALIAGVCYVGVMGAPIVLDILIGFFS